MKKTIDLYSFRDAFQRVRSGNFSYEGLEALFGYLEEYEDSTGEEIELDVIGICCDYSEHNSAREAISDCGYGWEPDPDDSKEDNEVAALEWLQDQTTVIPVAGGGVIIQSF